MSACCRARDRVREWQTDRGESRARADFDDQSIRSGETRLQTVIAQSLGRLLGRSEAGRAERRAGMEGCWKNKAEVADVAPPSLRFAASGTPAEP